MFWYKESIWTCFGKKSPPELVLVKRSLLNLFLVKRALLLFSNHKLNLTKPGMCFHHFPRRRVEERMSPMQFADFFAAYYARIYYLLRTIFDKILYHQEKKFPRSQILFCFTSSWLKVIIYKFYLLFKTLTLIRTAMKQYRYTLYSSRKYIVQVHISIVVRIRKRRKR